MIKVLANDGIHPAGKAMLEAAGCQVDTDKVAQEDLIRILPDYDAICVRSATKVRADLIDQCPDLKVIARGGVGLDNIDVSYAKSRDIAIYNTPAASSRSVAELAMGHIFALSRSLHQANRTMPLKGNSEFKSLKKAYSKGFELGGKTLGVIGLGRIGRETAKLAMGVGMHIVVHDPYVEEVVLKLPHLSLDGKTYSRTFKPVDLDTLLRQSDVITLHVPFTGTPIISAKEMSKMRKGACLINVARGGVVDEMDLLDHLNNGQIAGAGLDVFETEPTPNATLLNHPNVSLTPHTGASTQEAPTADWG